MKEIDLHLTKDTNKNINNNNVNNNINIKNLCHSNIQLNNNLSILSNDCKNILKNITFGYEMRNCFSLDNNMIFLNHASYGTAPNIVLTAKAYFMNKMEKNPEKFIRRDIPNYIKKSIHILTKFINADSQDTVFVTNATTGINAVLRSLDFQEEDEVLCLNVTHPAVLNTLRYICYYTQEITELKILDIHLPLISYEDLLNQVQDNITKKTRLAVFDHISSPTGLVLPLNELIKLFHKHNIPVLIDGANAPGQIPLDLKKLNADFYVGNCYKWLYTAKSVAFLYVNKKYQNSIKPIVTSYGYEQGFNEDFRQQGTKDESNYLTISTAIDFFYSCGGFDKIYNYNKELITWASEYLSSLWNTEPLLPEWQRAPFISAIRLPITCSNNNYIYTNEQMKLFCEYISNVLMDNYNIVMLTAFIQGQLYVRISGQIYNEKNDYILLGNAILHFLENNAQNILNEELKKLSLN